MASIAERVPFLRSLRGYRLPDLGRDAVAAILITATAIPLGVGFAQAAGLPPIVGLYTSMAPLIVFGLLSSTRHVKLGLDAPAAAMIGAVLVPMAAHDGRVDDGLLLALCVLVSVLTGAILLIAGLARAGYLANLLSLPLLVGYQAGIGLSVIVGQLPKLLGVADPGGNDLARLAGLAPELGATHWPTALLALACLVILLAGHAWRPSFPTPIVVLIVGTALSAVAGFERRGIAVIGELPSGLPAFRLPDLDVLTRDGWGLAGVAASLALVIASDVIIASRTFAARNGYRVSANVDIGALGAAEIAAGLTGGVPASASYVRTAVAEHARSRTQVSSILGGLFMAGVVAWATGLLSLVPLAVLGAICVDVCLRLVDVRAIARLWRQRRTDAVIAVVTCLLVLVTDPLIAIGVAVAFSVLTFLVRALRPDSSRMGQRAGVKGWFPIDDYGDATVRELDTVVFDWNGPLVFSNAEVFHDRVLAQCRQGVAHVIVDCSAMFDIDPSALEVLEDMVEELRKRGIGLWLAAPPPDAMAELRRADFPARMGKGPRVFLDIDTALAAIGKIPPPGGQLGDSDGDGIFEYRIGA